MSVKETTGLGEGEGTERLWKILGEGAYIMKEMSLEHREDVLTELLLHVTAHPWIWKSPHRLLFQIGHIQIRPAR